MSSTLVVTTFLGLVKVSLITWKKVKNCTCNVQILLSFASCNFPVVCNIFPNCTPMHLVTYKSWHNKKFPTTSEVLNHTDLLSRELNIIISCYYSELIQQLYYWFSQDYKVITSNYLQILHLMDSNSLHVHEHHLIEMKL